MYSLKHKNENGAINGSLITIVLLSILFLAAGSAAIWAYSNYTEQKTNVDGKISLAVAVAEKKQAENDAEKFANKEKEPNRQFVGPEDYGRLVFNYPKTWSVYIAQEVAEGGEYLAYLNPELVPPVSETQQFSLRVIIKQTDYDRVLEEYNPRVESGDLRSSVFTANGNNGIRFDGKFTENIRGAVVVMKVRDKTVILQTDADTFKPDFENIIKTINFNQ